MKKDSSVITISQFLRDYFHFKIVNKDGNDCHNDIKFTHKDLKKLLGKALMRCKSENYNKSNIIKVIDKYGSIVLYQRPNVIEEKPAMITIEQRKRINLGNINFKKCSDNYIKLVTKSRKFDNRTAYKARKEIRLRKKQGSNNEKKLIRKMPLARKYQAATDKLNDYLND